MLTYAAHAQGNDFIFLLARLSPRWVSAFWPPLLPESCWSDISSICLFILPQIPHSAGICACPRVKPCALLDHLFHGPVWPASGHMCSHPHSVLSRQNISYSRNWKPRLPQIISRFALLDLMHATPCFACFPPFQGSGKCSHHVQRNLSPPGEPSPSGLRSCTHFGRKDQSFLFC